MKTLVLLFLLAIKGADDWRKELLWSPAKK